MMLYARRLTLPRFRGYCFLNALGPIFSRTKFTVSGIDENDLMEKFVRGSGPGGQSVNTAKNNVQLIHIPTGVRVNCHEQRDLTSNRKIARKILRDKLDLLENGKDSKLAKRQEKIRRRKSKAKRRSDKKYTSTESDSDSVVDVDGDS